MSRQGLILICCLIFNAGQAQGCDLGNIGTSFRIKEEGFVSMMMRKLKEIDFEKEQQKMEKLARQRIEDPDPLEGIKPAIKTREFWHDPAFVLKDDVVLPCGRVLYKAGTAVNPLDHMDLERRLFFVDSREEAQIEWLKERLNEKKEWVIEDKIILVAGSVLKLKEELGVEVYFDQNGEITGKWGIKSSPAIARQDGKMIKIKEVKVEK